MNEDNETTSRLPWSGSLVPGSITVRFYEELNDYLPAEWQKCDVSLPLGKSTTIGELLVSLGMPLDVVDLVLQNGEPVPLSALLQAGDRLSVFPVFEALNLSEVTTAHSKPLRDLRFLADAHLGGLARYLRLVGFDTLFANDPGDAALVRISIDERRVLLTRDRGLLQRRGLQRVYRVRATEPRAQLREVLSRFDLFRTLAPFTRCLRCNGAVIMVGSEQVADMVPAGSAGEQRQYWRCAGCGRVYWRGSHFRRMCAFVEELSVNTSEECC